MVSCLESRVSSCDEYRYVDSVAGWGVGGLTGVGEGFSFFPKSNLS